MVQVADNQINQELTNCRACLEKDTIGETVFARNMRTPEFEQFKYFLCGCCGSLSISYVPDDLSKYYEGYYSFGPVGKKDKFIKHYAKLTYLRNMLPETLLSKYVLTDSTDLAYKALKACHPKKNTHILDVGSGTGQLVFDLHNYGFKNAVGIDPYLNQDMHYPNGAIALKQSIKEQTDCFEIIMLHHTFEHVEDPYATLEELRKIMHKHSQLIIRIPNVDSYAFRRFRKYWYGIQAPVHICLPSHCAMSKMLQKHGMKIKKIIGENVLEFWMHSLAYELNIWDYHNFGIRTFLEKSNISKPLFLSKQEITFYKKKNIEILKQPLLCDWIAYIIELEDA